MKLVNANQAKEFAASFFGDPILKMAVGAVMDNMPAADAVEVVRCKECKWRGTKGCWFYAPGRCVDRADDDFCSDGERNSNE